MTITKEQRIGMRYGRLTVIGIFGTYRSVKCRGMTQFLCRCDCGTEMVKLACSLNQNLSGCRSCFSLRMSDLHTVHGGSKGGKNRLFNIWKGMKKRCRSKTGKNAKNYAMRGIFVCADWDDFGVFRQWAQSHGYADNLTIERDNVNGNYEPANCRWISKPEQSRNKRNNRFINVRGTIMTAAEAERAIGLPPATINGFRNNHEITHQEAFDRLFCCEVLKAVNAERIAA